MKNTLLIITGLLISFTSYANDSDDYNECLESTERYLNQEYRYVAPPMSLDKMAKQKCDGEFSEPRSFEPWITLPDGRSISKKFGRTYLSLKEASDFCQSQGAVLPTLEFYQEIAAYMKSHDDNIERLNNSNIIKRLYNCIANDKCDNEYIAQDGSYSGWYWTSTKVRDGDGVYEEAPFYMTVANIYRLISSSDGGETWNRRGYDLEYLEAPAYRPRYVRCMR